MSARHKRQLAQAKVRRERGRGIQAGHRWLPDVAPIGDKWLKERQQEFDAPIVERALASRGESLAKRAIQFSSDDVMALCAEYRMEPETVLDMFGPDIFAASIQSLSGDSLCLNRQLKAIRQFLSRADIARQLNAWRTVRIAS